MLLYVLAETLVYISMLEKFLNAQPLTIAGSAY